jgi:hypothetical protein
MNKIIISYLIEKSYKVVAVFGHHDIGKDAGEVAGIQQIGVPITHASEANTVLA